VRHLVGETLHVVGRKVEVVMDTNEMSRRNCPLTDMLRYEVEVVVIPFGDSVVHDRTGWGVFQALWRPHEKLSVDPLLNHDDG
jgi:hypothetical protein